MQRNSYWSSQNLHLTHEVLPHTVKIGVWCAVSARRILGHVPFNKTIIVKICTGRSRAVLSRLI
jgi:hypothetical protein